MKKTLLLSAFLLCVVWIASGQWTYTNLSSPKRLMGIATDGTRAYFAGGHDGSNTLSLVESYNVESGSWANTGNLSIARQAVDGTACGSKVFFGGGVSSNMATVYSTVDIYDIDSEQWTVQQLSVSRFDISAVSHGNKVLFAGGCNFNIVCTDVVDIYDVTTGSWSVENLSSARAGMAEAVAGDFAVFAGGFLDGGEVSDQVDIYNFATGIWTPANLSEARVWATAVAVNDKIIIAGGIKSFPNVPSDRVDIFNTSDGTWTTATLSEARAWISGGAVNGKAYFAGGSNVANGGIPYDFTAVVDIYNDADSSWTTDSLAQPRSSQGLAVGNHLLVAGGTGGTGLLATVEIYTDPTLIHVPADYPTIQQGIEAADPGDTVLVADNTYFENINFIGKAILVASEYIMDGDTNHISNTIINGSQPANPDLGSVVVMMSGEDTTSVLCGFTITGGAGTFIAEIGGARFGGGIFLLSGGKVLNNYIEYNIITNDYWTAGGGICAIGPVEDTMPLPWVVLRGNRINHNKAISLANEGDGGGVDCFYSLVFTDNQVSYNEATGPYRGDGGGVRIRGDWGPLFMDVRNNTITYNKAASDSSMTDVVLTGGLSVFWDCSGIISGNTVSFNEIEVPEDKWGYGNGILIDQNSPDDLVLENNIIEGNTFTGRFLKGGGLCIWQSSCLLRNNVIKGNTGSDGGGIFVHTPNDTAVLINNTIIGNHGDYGGGLYVTNADAVIINTIVWGNTATSQEASVYQEGSTLEVRYSDIESGTVWPGEGNINGNPVFIDDAWHIDDSSPCYDAGIATIEISGNWYFAPLTDLEGTLRPFGEGFDIGADEYDGEGVEDFLVQSSDFKVQSYPNPVGDISHFTFLISQCQYVTLKIYDVQGREIAVLADEKMPAGEHTISFDTSGLQAGIYVYRLTTDDYRLAAGGKMVKY